MRWSAFLKRTFEDAVLFLARLSEFENRKPGPGRMNILKNEMNGRALLKAALGPGRLLRGRPRIFCIGRNKTETNVPCSPPYTYVSIKLAVPNAKFILSVRESADEWYSSVTRVEPIKYGKGEVLEGAAIFRENKI